MIIITTRENIKIIQKIVILWKFNYKQINLYKEIWKLLIILAILIVRIIIIVVRIMELLIMLKILMRKCNNSNNRIFLRKKLKKMKKNKLKLNFKLNLITYKKKLNKKIKF